MKGEQTSQQKLADFWKPVQKKYQVSWTTDEENGLMIAIKTGLNSFLDAEAVRIASFDLDHTLIRPKGKRRFSQHQGDWDFLFPQVPGKIVELSKDGYRIVIFTNQNGLENADGSDDEERRLFQEKIENVFSKFASVEIILIAAMKKNIYRKPCTGMWEHYIKHFLSSPAKLDKERSFFVGDAAGRPKSWKSGASADFASTDRKFALNLGLTFHTPEEFFLNFPPSTFHLGFCPKSLAKSELKQQIVRKEKELVIFVGSPASGKTTFFLRHYKSLDYVWINQDTLGTRDKCLAQFMNCLSEGNSIVLDNTNPSSSGRAEYIALAKKAGYTITCARFNVDHQIVSHLNHFRAITQKRSVLSKAAFTMFDKTFQEPSLAEGFDEIFQVPFCPSFEDSTHEELFNTYLC